MSLQVSPVGTELLDDLSADPADVETSLRNIARANRLFGGLAAVRRGLRQVLPSDYHGALTLLDVGTGAGDVPVMAGRWLGRRDIQVRGIGLERHPVAARTARRAGLTTVLGCGGRLPFPDRSLDVVVLSQVAHHLAREACVTLFRECGRVARLGGVVADLRRSQVAAAAYRVAAPLLGFDRHTARDGVVSLRRGFSAAELRRLTREAGLAATVCRSYGARLVASWRTVP